MSEKYNLDFNRPEKIFFVGIGGVSMSGLALILADAGFDVCMEGVTASSDADNSVKLVIINTCAVTQKAEQKARRLIRLVLKKFSCAAVLVTGCYAQLSCAQIEKIDERIVVLGGQIKSRVSVVPELLKKFVATNGVFECAAFITALKKQVEEIVGYFDLLSNMTTAKILMTHILLQKLISFAKTKLFRDLIFLT